MTKQPYEPSPFALSPKEFEKALPKHLECSDEDLAQIKIPGWRYDQISEAVLAMYERSGANVMPLPILDIIHGLGYSIAPYRALGPLIYEPLMKASPDALFLQFGNSSTPIILFNDRQQPKRINFSIMHEVGHIELKHYEHCGLAEKEANYFASVALCPLDLLEHYGIGDEQKIVNLFNVSNEFAYNRMKALNNRKGKHLSESALKFRSGVINRFKFSEAYQMDIFADAVSF